MEKNWIHCVFELDVLKLDETRIWYKMSSFKHYKKVISIVCAFFRNRLFWSPGHLLKVPSHEFKQLEPTSFYNLASSKAFATSSGSHLLFNCWFEFSSRVFPSCSQCCNKSNKRVKISFSTCYIIIFWGALPQKKVLNRGLLYHKTIQPKHNNTGVAEH